MANKWLKSFTEKAVKVTKKTGKNVNTLISIKKIDLDIAKTSKEIKQIFKAIGEVVYNCRDTKKDSSNIEILCKQIDTKKTYINELNKRRKMILEKQKLEMFDVQVTDDMPSFIIDGNTKDLDESEIEKSIGHYKFCEKCSTGNDPKAEHCKKCGKKL